MGDVVLELFDDYRETIDAFVTKEQTAGVIVGLIRDGELIASHAAGETQLGNGTPPTIDTVFRIASMTKSFTACAILLLRDRGMLALEEPVVTYLPWTASIGAPAGAKPLTVRDLLTMNGGFPTDDPWGDRQEPTPIAEFDALVTGGLSFSHAPGTGFEYSNLGYALLGRIISRVSGVDYLEFVERELLVPLGMKSSTYFSDRIEDGRRAFGYARVDDLLVPEAPVPPGAFSPMGGLHSTVRDLTTWVRGFADDDRAPHPLAAASRREMQHEQAFVMLAERENATGSRWFAGNYGFGLFIDRDEKLGRVVSHSGGYPGFGSHMRWHPQSGLGIVSLSNRTYAPARSLAVELFDRLIAAMPPAAATPATLWPETREAMELAERLLERWDDALGDRIFAANIDLDTPRASRRAAVSALRERLGPFERIPGSLETTTAAGASWRVRGVRGDELEIDVLLTPQKPPRLQLLNFKPL